MRRALRKRRLFDFVPSYLKAYPENLDWWFSILALPLIVAQPNLQNQITLAREDALNCCGFDWSSQNASLGGEKLEKYIPGKSVCNRVRPLAAVIAFESRSSTVHSFITGTNLPLHSRRHTSTFRSHQEPSLSSAIEKNVACSRPRQDDGENELVQPGFVLPLAWDEKLLSHQAVGQGAPQTIIRRSLPQCFKLVNADVLVGTR